MWGLSLKYDFERQLQTRSATSTTNSLVAGFCSLFTLKSFSISAWNLPLRASKVSLSKLGQLFDPLQVSAVSKKPKTIDNFAKFGSAFASSTLKTSTTDDMSFRGKQLGSVLSILVQSAPLRLLLSGRTQKMYSLATVLFFSSRKYSDIPPSQELEARF